MVDRRWSRRQFVSRGLSAAPVLMSPALTLSLPGGNSAIGATASSPPPGLSFDHSDSSRRDIPERLIAEHWSVGKNQQWRWYERENVINGFWKKTGIATPINRLTDELLEDRDGYLDLALVPESVLIPQDRKRIGMQLFDSNSWRQRLVATKSNHGPQRDPGSLPIQFGDRSHGDAGRSSDQRRSQHGRPPSQWLRSLNAEEIRTWLAKVEIQDAHVRGMTFWTHLVRDHLFDAERIRGLTEPELAELHGAAHEGF